MSVLDRIRDGFKYLDKNGMKHLIDKTERIFRFSTMPAAGADYVNNLVQYTGTTNLDYTNGFFYKSVLNGSTYEWQQINVQPNDDTPHWHGTHAEYDADPTAVPAGAYVTFTDDVDTGFDSGLYRNTETVTGKAWTDGRPIYRKCYTLTNSSSTAAAIYLTADLGFNDLDYPVMAQGVALGKVGSADGVARILNFCYSENLDWCAGITVLNNDVSVAADKNKITAHLGSAIAAEAGTVHIVLEYVKTSDL